MFKRIIASAVIAILFTASLLSVNVMAENQYTWGDLTYTVSEDGATIIGCSEDLSAVVNIPEKINGYDVVEIADWVFEYREGITEIVIPDSVTRIGKAAFRNCFSLKKVTLSNKLTELGISLFECCRALEEIVIPHGVEIIDWGAFGGCTGLKRVYIPKSVTIVVNNAFSDCDALTDVYYSSSEEDWNGISIDYANDYLTDATIHYNYSNGETIVESGNIGSKVKWKIDSDGLLTISGTGGFSFGNGDPRTQVPWYEFDIENVVVEDGITSIGNRGLSTYAFKNSYKIKSIKILNSSVISVGKEAFDQMGAKIEFSGPVKVEGYRAFYHCGNLTEITLSDDTYCIPDYSFDTTGLKSIIIPYGVSMIGEYAFNWCYLENVTIPGTVLSIGKNAFSCPDDGYYTVDSDGWHWVDYFGINKVCFGASKEQWGNVKIFAGNSKLENAEFLYADNSTGQCTESISWSVEDCKLTLSGSGEISDYVYGKRGTDTNKNLPYPQWLLCNYDTLKIGEGITAVGRYAFDEAVTEYYGVCSFSEDEDDTKVYWDAYNPYYTLDKVKTVIIPESVKTISYGAFDTLTKLSDVYYAGSKADWENISIEDENTSLLNANIHYDYKDIDEVKVTVNGMTAKLTRNGNKTGVIIIALYDQSGPLMEAKIMNPEETISFDSPSLGRFDKVNIMWVESLENMKPLSKNETRIYMGIY